MLLYYAPQKYVSLLAFYIPFGFTCYFFCFVLEETASYADQAGFELTAVGETGFDVLIPAFASQVLGL